MANKPAGLISPAAARFEGAPSNHLQSAPSALAEGAAARFGPTSSNADGDVTGVSRDVRNVAIIAHVDHGKTTLADALLHKAGLLAGGKAGDQAAGRALDVSKEERERGITIKSTGVTLEFHDCRDELYDRARLEALERASTFSPVPPAAPGSELVELYVGNLPSGLDRDELIKSLATAGGMPAAALKGLILNARRHFAFVKLDSTRARQLVASAAAGSGIEIGGRRIDVCERGSSPVATLAKVLELRKLPAARYEVNSCQFSTGHTASWIGKASVDGLGLAVCSEPQSSQREVRKVLAKRLLWIATGVSERTASGPVRKVQTEVSQAPKVDQTTTELEPLRRVLTINLIDSPGHVDFSGEVTAALRMTDGALVVVDVADGPSAQTDTVLRQALQERVRPVLLLNKVDRLILEKQCSPVETFDRMCQVITEVNAIIAESGGPEVSLEDGTVAFGSGYFQWALSLDTVVSAKHPALGAADGKRRKLRIKLARRELFVAHVLDPIYKIHRELGLLANDPSSVPPEDPAGWIKQFNVKLAKKHARPVPIPSSPTGLAPRKLLKLAMSALLPAADALVDLVATKLPSPAEAQAYRIAELVDGNDDAAERTRRAIVDCAPGGRLVLFVSKIVDQFDAGSRHGGKSLAVCRSFSGTVKPGQVVHVAGEPSRTARVSAVLQCSGKVMKSVPQGDVGQIFALAGVVGLLHKNGTLTAATTELQLYPISPLRAMGFGVSPIVRKSIKPAQPRQLLKMVAAMRQAVQADQTALFFQDSETNEYVLAGAGELHLEVLINSVADNHGIKVVASQPMVSFRESVRATSTPALKKSANKHNRLWFVASPLSPQLVDGLESRKVDTSDLKVLGRALVEQYGWDKHNAARIWAVGPEPLSGGLDATGGGTAGATCILANATTGLQIPSDAKDTIISAFERVVREGVMVGEQLYGIKLELVDAKFHMDSNHRSGAQVDPAARSAMRGAIAMASPVLIEPLYKVEVRGPSAAVNAVYGELTGRRRGMILSADDAGTGSQASVICEMPIRLAFGLTGAVRGLTSGKGFVTSGFGGWKEVDGILADGDDSAGEAAALGRSIRAAKQLAVEIPTARDFIDRL